VPKEKNIKKEALEMKITLNLALHMSSRMKGNNLKP
jgi:hypothetical protein